MKKLLIIILALAAIGALSLLSWRFYGKPDVIPSPTSTPSTSTPLTTTPPTGTEGITIQTPKWNETASSPLKVTGFVDGKNHWAPFEAQAGIVSLYDNTGKLLDSEIMVSLGDWMKFPSYFEANLEFDTSAPSGELVFRNDNASGLPEFDREYRMPVKFEKKMMTLKAFFANTVLDPEISCNKVFSVSREVPKTTAVARAALDELLKGPTEAEKSAGYMTSINPGVKIQSLTISATGTAYVDFDQKLQEGVGGSCRVGMIRWEIVETLKQFPTVKNVVISINGNSEEILQP